MFFDGWENVIRVIAVGVLAYCGLIVMLRISGNRTLSKMNSFDLVVTVAFGSTLSTILVNKDVSLTVGLVAIGLLVVLQLVITWTSARSTAVARIVKTAPTILLRNGVFLEDPMTRARVTADEIRAAVRQQGIGATENVAVVILESDGSLSVIATDNAGSGSACEGVRQSRRARAASEV